MSRVGVLTPWRPGCGHRERAWEWLKPRWPWPVTEAIGSEPWSKGGALYPALLRSEAEIVVVADADVHVDATEAVRAVEGGATWAIPHTDVRRLSEESTGQLMAGVPWKGLALSERPYRGMAGGGVLVARREVLLSCPLDPRFVGWG